MDAEFNRAQITDGSFSTGVEVASLENIQILQTSIPLSSMSSPSYKIIPESYEILDECNKNNKNKKKLGLNEKILLEYLLAIKKKHKIKLINIKRIKFAEKEGYRNNYLTYLKKKFKLKNDIIIINDYDSSLFEEFKTKEEESHKEYFNEYNNFIGNNYQ